jgi:murein DD-endopeptidase MepM/ murein hydrolase activator NlpD
MNRFVLALLVLVVAAFAFVLLRPQAAAPVAASAVENTAEAPGLEGAPIHEMRSRDINGPTEYLVRNLIAGPIEVRCTLEKADNATTEPPLPRTLVLPAHGEQQVAVFKVVDTARPHASGSISCGAMLGDPRARPQEDVQYALPFPAGTKFTLDQGFGGKFSHNDVQNHYALDFGVAEGTPVLAARAGVVMQVEEGFRAHGTDARFADRANYVRVLHDDGSMAVYAHLAPASMLRMPGDRVVVGQMIGKSGNTGFSTGPHLHFCIQRNAGMSLVSIPFSVAGVDLASARD